MSRQDRCERAREARAETHEIAARHNMHLTFRGLVLCGDNARSMYRMHVSAIAHPLTRSIKQSAHLQRKVLGGRSICPACWKAMRVLAESGVVALFASDDEIAGTLVNIQALETGQ